MPTVVRHDPRCFPDGPPHRDDGVCFGKQAQTRTGAWVPFPAPLADCNLSDFDGWCYVHGSMKCQEDTMVWDRAHGT